MADSFCNSHCRTAFHTDCALGAIYGAVHGLTAEECGEAGILSHEEYYRRNGVCPYCRSLTNPKRRYRYLQHGKLQPFRGVTWR
jgi:hypothetical protein